MTVHVDLHEAPSGGGAASVTYSDRDLASSDETYCYHVGAGGELIIVIDDRGESRIERVYSPSAWHCVEGDVWRKGALLQGG